MDNAYGPFVENSLLKMAHKESPMNKGNNGSITLLYCPSSSFYFHYRVYSPFFFFFCFTASLTQIRHRCFFYRCDHSV